MRVRDCDIWLKSKGSLPVEKQQYGQWIRASQFNPIRRQYVEVKGYEARGSQPLPRDRQTEMRVQPRLTGTEVFEEVEMLTTDSDFEAIIEGIDKEIRNEGSAPNQIVTEIVEKLNGAGKVVLEEDETHGDNPVQAFVGEGSNENIGTDSAVGDIHFNAGWSEQKTKSKGLRKS
nr:hypothetical protein CFP56_01905 [Quercus suber]